MGLYASFTTNEDKEQHGTWVNYDGCSFLVARSGGSNKKYQKTLELLTQPYRRLLESKNTVIGDSVNKKLDAVLARVFAISVIKDWKDVDDENGVQLEFNEENCVKVLTDLPALFKDIQEVSSDVSNYKVDSKEDDAKN